MSETIEQAAPKEEEKVNIFNDDAKNIVVPNNVDPAIVEKDKKIEEVKPIVDKPNEPEKIPTASPKDIPSREAPKEEVVAPLKPANEIKFANKTSEKIFNLLTAQGENKESSEDALLEYLSIKKTLSSLDKLPASEKIKLQLKNENKDYTAEEINDLFSETYVYPEKPEAELSETEEEFEVRLKKYEDKVAKIDRRIEREAKKASVELLKQNENLVLPEIQKPEATIQQPSQEELDKVAKARENYLSSIGDGLENFKSIDATFKDKDVDIKVAYKVSAEERAELHQTMENFNLENFIKDRWLTEDGKFNTLQQAKDILQLTKGDEITAKLINEAVSKKEAEVRKSIRNVDYSGNNRSADLTPSAQEEMDKAARHFFAN